MNKKTNKPIQLPASSSGRLTRDGDGSRKKIMEYLEQHEVKICPVSFQEIADGTGLSRTSIMHHLDIMERVGVIRKSTRGKQKRLARHIQIVREDNKVGGTE